MESKADCSGQALLHAAGDGAAAVAVAVAVAVQTPAQRHSSERVCSHTEWRGAEGHTNKRRRSDIVGPDTDSR